MTAASTEVRQLRDDLLVENVAARVDAQHCGTAVRPLGDQPGRVGDVELVHGPEDSVTDVLSGQPLLHLDGDQVRPANPVLGVPIADVEL